MSKNPNHQDDNCKMGLDGADTLLAMSLFGLWIVMKFHLDQLLLNITCYCDYYEQKFDLDNQDVE